MSANDNFAFLRTFVLVLAVLVAVIVAVLFFTGSSPQDFSANGEQRLQAEVAKRIAPVGSVQTGAANAAPAAPKSGAEIVATVCSACHGSGALGAPKIGDRADWSSRLKEAGSVDGLLAVAIKGRGAMPPRGGSPNLSDAELKSAIEQMLKKSGMDVSAAADADAGAPAAAAPVKAPAPAEATAATATPTAEAEQAKPSADLAKGKSVYNSVCATCHKGGLAGAPKLGDAAAWAPRIATGMDALYSVALNGRGAMPPKGGRVDLSDADVKAAVDYMVSQSQ